MSMKIPHVKNMFKAGNPGFKAKFKPGIGPDDLGKTLIFYFFCCVLIWFIIKTVI